MVKIGRQPIEGSSQQQAGGMAIEAYQSPTTPRKFARRNMLDYGFFCSTILLTVNRTGVIRDASLGNGTGSLLSVPGAARLLTLPLKRWEQFAAASLRVSIAVDKRLLVVAIQQDCVSDQVWRRYVAVRIAR